METLNILLLIEQQNLHSGQDFYLNHHLGQSPQAMIPDSSFHRQSS